MNQEDEIRFLITMFRHNANAVHSLLASIRPDNVVPKVLLQQKKEEITTILRDRQGYTQSQIVDLMNRSLTL